MKIMSLFLLFSIFSRGDIKRNDSIRDKTSVTCMGWFDEGGEVELTPGNCKQIVLEGGHTVLVELDKD